MPDLEDTPDWMHQMAESIGDADPDDVVGQLLEHFGELSPARWQAVVSHPKPCLETIARALLGAAAILTALWAGTSARMDVELARLEQTLADPDAIPMYLNTLSPLVKLVDDTLLLSYARNIPIALLGKLALAPMIAPPRSYLFFDMEQDLCLGYPMADSASYLFAEPAPERGPTS